MRHWKRADATLARFERSVPVDNDCMRLFAMPPLRSVRVAGGGEIRAGSVLAVLQQSPSELQQNVSPCSIDNVRLRTGYRKISIG